MTASSFHCIGHATPAHFEHLHLRESVPIIVTGSGHKVSPTQDCGPTIAYTSSEPKKHVWMNSAIITSKDSLLFPLLNAATNQAPTRLSHLYNVRQNCARSS